MPSTQEMWDRMNSAFKAEFEVGLEQTYNIFECSMVSAREDDRPLTAEQVAWLKGYEAGR